MLVCPYIFMNVYILHKCIHVFIPLYMHSFINVHMDTCLYICMHSWMDVLISVRIYVHINPYMHA